MQILDSVADVTGAGGRTIGIVRHTTSDGEVVTILLEENGSTPRVAVPTVRWGGRWIKAAQWTRPVWEELEARSLAAFSLLDGAR